jgi:HD domain
MDTAARRLLATMPLHAITTTYGEDGLRERFAQEIAVFDPAERRRLERALDLAGRLHAADRRQREPYVNHLLRVAIRILSYYGVREPDVVCAALLHDAVEDHPAELAASRRQPPAPAAAGGQQAGDGGQQAALAVVAAEFGPRVAELVAAVTNPVWRPGRNQHEQYREHVAASLEECPWARVIKVSDFTDNGVGLIHTTGPALDRLAGKYAPLVPVLREMIARPDTPLSDQAKARITGQLDLAAERFAAISDSSGPATPGHLSQ